MKKCKCGSDKKIGGKTCGNASCVGRIGLCDVENCFRSLGRCIFMCHACWEKKCDKCMTQDDYKKYLAS